MNPNDLVAIRALLTQLGIRPEQLLDVPLERTVSLSK